MRHYFCYYEKLKSSFPCLYIHFLINFLLLKPRVGVLSFRIPDLGQYAYSEKTRRKRKSSHFSMFISIKTLKYFILFGAGLKM